MRAFITPQVLDELRLCGELNLLNQRLEAERYHAYLQKQKIKALEKRLSQAEETIKTLVIDRELDLSRLSAIQFWFEKEISALKEKLG